MAKPRIRSLRNRARTPAIVASRTGAGNAVEGFGKDGERAHKTIEGE